MFSSIKVDSHCQVVPHYTQTELFKNNPTIKLSTEKVNVIVGPNGSGKSSLLQMLGDRFFATTAGVTSADRNYCDRFDYPNLFTNKKVSYRNDQVFAEGLSFEGSLSGLAYYYHPEFKPGNYDMLTAAMMCGFSKEVEVYRAATRHKSSGQQKSALLNAILKHVTLFQSQNQVLNKNRWSGSLTASTEMPWNASESDVRRNIICQHLPTEFTEMLVLLDEPEQSLDTVSELRLWDTLINKDPAAQIIVATHSLRPFMLADQVHFIEAVPGYVKSVQNLI